MDFLTYYDSTINVIGSAFQLIFPELPSVGIAVCLLTIGLFSYYLVKSGLQQALKISLVVLGVMLFILYMVHSFDKLFFA